MPRFLLNDEEYQMDLSEPGKTVLDVVRDELKLKGTKEGCASGDCGACTVVLASDHRLDGQLVYKTVNSCITLMGNIDGQQLITVEHLKNQSKLHPSQSSLVQTHGSQCGFCTPGFVMSLFASYKNRSGYDREQILSDLGGNLCSCTGYAPIIQAAESMFEKKAIDQFDERLDKTKLKLKALQEAIEKNASETAKNRFLTPCNSDLFASALIDHPEAKIVAGTTDFGLEITQNLKTFDKLISTSYVRDMALIDDTEESLIIGGSVTLTNALPVLIEHFPGLREILYRFGSLQVRNQATIAGNIAYASPVADMPPVLMVLDAGIVLRKGDRRRTVLLDEFYLGYKETVLEQSEFIESICIPKPLCGKTLRAYKISKRVDDDISSCSMAISVECEGEIITSARIACGGMSEIPKRAIHCEASLAGTRWSEQAFVEAAKKMEDDFTPISDARASDLYRMAVSKNLLKRYWLELDGQADFSFRIDDYG